jgi:uncharacterized protein
MGAPVVGGGIGAILLAIVVTLLGGDPSAILQQASQPNQNDGGSQTRSPEEEKLADFSRVVLAQTEDAWTEIFREQGLNYRKPTLVLFTGQVRSACGSAQSAMGPFYCPLDEKVYLDLGFFQEMEYKLQAPGDFAQAYVIAHEVGHHVQKQLGISDQVQSLQRRVGQTEANQLSVMLELQADCFAGVWGNRTEQTQRILEAGDIEEALNAASQIGDDRLQARSQGYIVPDAFTHGSAAQRVRWFKRGLQTGDPAQCDTFNARSL